VDREVAEPEGEARIERFLDRIRAELLQLAAAIGVDVTHSPAVEHRGRLDLLALGSERRLVRGSERAAGEDRRRPEHPVEGGMCGADGRDLRPGRVPARAAERAVIGSLPRCRLTKRTASYPASMPSAAFSPGKHSSSMRSGHPPPALEDDAGLAWPRTAACFVVDARGVVSRSRDAGATWRKVGRVGQRPVAFAASGSELYVALRDDSIRMSLDGGRTWTLRASG
jgi:hypothetical protein